MGHRVNREEFLNTLHRVSPGLSKRGTIAQSSCFVFADGWITTFNEEICCRSPSGLPDDLTAAVQADPLLRWVDAVGEPELEISTTTREFQVRAGRKKTGIRMEAEIVLPIDDVELPDSWQPLPDDWTRGVEQVMGTAGGADSDFMVRCVHIHPDYVEACDRKHATRYHVKTPVDEAFLVLATTIGHTINLDLTKIGQTGDWVHLRNKLLIFSCRRHLEQYPTDGVTEMLKFRGESATLPKGAEIAAKLAGIFTADNKTDARVSVKLSDGRMTIRGDGSQGWASDDIDTAYHGDPVIFRISPEHLIRLVKNHSACELSSTRLRIVGDNWSYLTVLGKADDGEPVAVTVPAADEPLDEEDNEDE